METPRPPSDAVRRTPPEEPMQCEYSSTRMELMESSNGARELLKEDEPYDEEAEARDLVAAMVKFLENLKSIYDQRLGGGFIQGLITCVSNYYTRKEMKAYMAASKTLVTAQEFDLLFDSLFADNEVGSKAYLEHSLRLEAIRGRMSTQPQQQLQVSPQQQVQVSQCK